MLILSIICNIFSIFFYKQYIHALIINIKAFFIVNLI